MNTHTSRPTLMRLTAIAVAAGGLALAGCDRADRDEAAARTDSAVADAQQQGAEVRADASRAGAEVRSEAREATADAKAAGSELKADASQAWDKTKTAVVDGTITATVKAELAKDPVLKAHEINVDTEQGRVVLRGTAPTADAKAKATQLASSVDGVKDVDNELTVAPKS